MLALTTVLTLYDTLSQLNPVKILKFYTIKINSSNPKSVQNYTLIFFLTDSSQTFHNVKSMYGIANTSV